MQKFCQRIFNRSNSASEETKDNIKILENSQLQPNTIEIQNHLIYCLENTSVNLFPAIAKIGNSSIQNEKLLLMRELIQHSKSFIEQPAKDDPQIGLRNLLQNGFLQRLQNQQANSSESEEEEEEEESNDDHHIDIEQDLDNIDGQATEQDEEMEYEDEEEDYEDDEDEDEDQEEGVQNQQQIIQNNTQSLQQQTLQNQNPIQNNDQNQNNQDVFNHGNDEEIEDEDQYRDYDGEDYD